MDRAPPSWAPLEREYGWGGDEKGGRGRAKPAFTGGIKVPHSFMQGFVSPSSARY